MTLAKILYQPYKWLVFTPFLGLSTAVFACLIALTCLVSQRIATRVLARSWAKLNFIITPACITVEGQDNLNSQQSYVVVANHISQFDIFALYGWLKLDLRWVMKKELRKVPFLGFAAAAMGSVFVDRENSKEATRALQDVKSNLVNGVSLMFFPEGTRSSSGKMLKFKRGAFSTAKDLQLPILPVTVLGTEKILPNKTLDLRPGRAKLIIHPPISAQDVETLEVIELMRRSREIIASALPEDRH